MNILNSMSSTDMPLIDEDSDEERDRSQTLVETKRPDMLDKINSIVDAESG